MPNAIELVVDGYVSLNNRRALDDLRMQRRKLAVDLKAAPVLIAEQPFGRSRKIST
jgi:hypothetical protein